MSYREFYRWIGRLVVVRLPDATVIEGILLEVQVPWMVVQEKGVRRTIHFGPGVVVTYAFDEEDPYHEGRARARENLAALREAKARQGDWS